MYFDTCDFFELEIYIKILFVLRVSSLFLGSTINLMHFDTRDFFGFEIYIKILFLVGVTEFVPS